MSIELFTEDRLVYQFYPVAAAAANFINFKVKTPNDAHIALTSTPYESQPMYEVFFGGWKNTKSVIRKNQSKPDVVEVDTPNILDANAFRGFWICWESGTLRAGIEGNPQPILTWHDSKLFAIQHFGICTGWGAKGHWIIEHSVPTQQPPQPLSSSAAAMGCCGSPPIPPPFAAAPGIGFNIPTTAPKWVPSSNGNLPPGAVVGGKDRNGETIYIARARHEGALLPGKLVPSHGVAYVAWGGRENPKSDYEVLCDCSAQWIVASGQVIPAGAFVGGNTEHGETLYIGRSEHEGSITPGKVQMSHGVCYIPYGGQEVQKQQFQILVI